MTEESLWGAEEAVPQTDDLQFVIADDSDAGGSEFEDLCSGVAISIGQSVAKRNLAPAL